MQPTATTSVSPVTGGSGSSRRIFTSLRFKFSLITTLVLGAIMAAVTWSVYNQTRQDLGREVRERGATIARNLASSASEAMILREELAMALLVRQSVQAEPDAPAPADWLSRLRRDLEGDRASAIRNQGVVEAVVVDSANSVVGHSDHTAANQLIGTLYRAPAYVRPAGGAEPFPVYLRQGREVYDIRVPIIQKLTRQVQGEVHLGLARDIIEQSVRTTAARIAAITLAALVLSAVLTFFLVSLLVAPVGRLVEGVEAIGAGDFSQRIKAGARDELGELAGAYNEMAKSLGENAALRAAFSRYTSASLMRDILNDPEKMAKLGGKRVQATMLFSMVLGANELSQTMEAEEFVAVINEYLSAQTRAIAANHGHIDKFVREEVMAVWGVPEPEADDAFNAVAAGVDCQKALRALNQRRRANDKPEFGVSIGINTGEVVAGNMGSQQKMDYTVIGDAVNTAARLMASGAGGQVLISEATYALVKNRVTAEALEPVRVKGKREPLKVWNVKSVKR